MVSRTRLTTCKPATEVPLSLLRPMTADEVAAKTRSKTSTDEVAKMRIGMQAALDIRARHLEANGVETEQARKKRKKEEAKSEKVSALKSVRGTHLLK